MDTWWMTRVRLNNRKVNYYDSREFTAAGYKWKMQLYPKGIDSGTGSHLSLYLVLADFASLTPPKIYADYSLVLSNELGTNGVSYQENHWFSASSRESGSANFIPLRFCVEPAYKYLVKDCLFFRAAVTIRGIASTL
ncbi:hypothetical protein Pint_24224 [Pistacia integerrima]|uniref:Uncharacterized protein n=1 Tax=Pistacia integerrima TaxID=434235 RepID=A0ACC0YG87_9ROSI|nr:hypothetical protein Pint_24224 [Pistacia integerrima]